MVAAVEYPAPGEDPVEPIVMHARCCVAHVEVKSCIAAARENMLKLVVSMQDLIKEVSK